MPRLSRSISPTGIYHIMFRGNERKNIFEDEDDKTKFIETLITKRNKIDFNIFAYSVMDNHAHLLIREGAEPLATTMKRIGVSYAIYYNNKHKRVGHVFQDRFKSESIKSDSQLLEVIRYIHNNPVKANMTKSASKYPWSSYQIYANRDMYNKNSFFKNILDDSSFILQMFSNNYPKAVSLFDEFTKQRTEDYFIDEVDKKEIKETIKRVLAERDTNLDQLKENKALRDNIIRILKIEYKISIRRISEALDINRNIVQRVK